MLIFCTMLCASTTLICCVNNPYISQIETPMSDDSIVYNDGEQESGIGNYMIVIKMSENVANHVIVGWPFFNGQYYRNDQMSILTDTSSTAIGDFAENVLLLCGESPYCPLINDYYLINWRWLGINRMGFYSSLSEIYENCYQTSLLWSDLTTLSISVSSDGITPLIIDEFWKLPNECIDKYRDALGTYNTFLGYNSSVYSGSGLCCDLAYQFYNDSNPVYGSYDNYVNICDSLFAIYQQCIIEAILKNDLNKLCYHYE